MGEGGHEATELSLLTRRVTRASLQLHHSLAARLDLAPVELAALTCVIDEGPLTPKRLGAMLALSTSSMTALLDRLVRDGWVRRRANPSDGRSVLVASTEMAHRKTRSQIEGMIADVRGIVTRRSLRERAIVEEFLRELIVVLEREANPPPSG